jgi:hypothetical protein
MIVERVGGWYVTVWSGDQGYVALAKREPFENGHPVHEPGEVHFSCGETKGAARMSLLRELLH